MKPIPLLFLAAAACITPFRSQDAKDPLPEEMAATPTAARILGSIPDRTPPPEPLTPEAEAIFLARAAACRETHPRTKMAFVSATIFRSKDSPPRSFVCCWPEGRRQAITFWSSADFGLIPGIHSFVDSTGATHAMTMGWGYADRSSLTDLHAARWKAYGATSLPNFPEGKAGFEIIGTAPAAEDLAPIQALHDLYNNEHVRLKSAFEGLERARIERGACLKANPPSPKTSRSTTGKSERAPLRKEPHDEFLFHPKSGDMV